MAAAAAVSLTKNSVHSGCCYCSFIFPLNSYLDRKQHKTRCQLSKRPRKDKKKLAQPRINCGTNRRDVVGRLITKLEAPPQRNFLLDRSKAYALTVAIYTTKVSFTRRFILIFLKQWSSTGTTTNFQENGQATWNEYQINQKAWSCNFLSCWNSFRKAQDTFHYFLPLLLSANTQIAGVNIFFLLRIGSN